MQHNMPECMARFRAMLGEEAMAEVLGMKPDAEGLTAHRVVMVGDTLTDMEFAHNAGLKAVGLASRAENRASLAPHADRMIGTLSELLEILE